jgi:hypothetical protein
MLSVVYAVSFMPSVTILSVKYKPLMLSVGVLNVIILSVIMLSVMAPFTARSQSWLSFYYSTICKSQAEIETQTV